MLDQIKMSLQDEFINITNEPWPSINSIDDIGSSATGGEYVAQLTLDSGECLSDIIIAYGYKAGNILISQQINQFILKNK